MKRTKLLALTLVVAIMMMGAGYALWDDVLTINQTVATGDVDVEWFWNNIGADPNGVFTANVLPAGGNLNRSPDKKAYTVTLENLYPGAEARWTGSMMNMGSLPVKFVSLDVEEGPDALNITDYLEVYYDTRYYDGTTWSGYNVQNWIPFDQFEAAMNADSVLKGYILKTNDRIQFGDESDIEPNCIKIRLKTDAPESLMNYTFTFDMMFTFQQAY